MSGEKEIKISLEGMYTNRVKTIFRGCGFYCYRVRGPKRDIEVSDVYFFNDHFSGWAALKIDSTFDPGSRKPFYPKWRKGEMLFLKELSFKEIRSIMIIEFKAGIYYSEDIKERYTAKDLLLFNGNNLWL